MKAVIAALVLIVGASSAVAQTVRTTIKPESGVVLGQPVRILVDVLFPGDMPRPPRVGMPEMPGGQILRYETQATTLNERVDGQEHVGQRFEFALYPRRGGPLEIPAPQVILLDRSGEETGRLVGTPTRLDVSVPPGVDPSKPVVATTDFSLEQTWSPAPTGAFKAGDALVRTVVRQAVDVPGMAMLDLAFAAPRGVRAYVEPPQIDDRVSRGDLTGRRTDRVTYVFERGGSFAIEAVVQPWWDLENKRLRRAEGQGATIAVTSAPVTADRGARIELWIYVATTVAGLLALLWGLWPRVRLALGRRRERWLASEPKAFRDLQAACRQGDARDVYRAFIQWRARSAHPTALAPLAEQIESVLFASSPWSQARARAFGERAAGARAARRPMPAPILPPLNPARDATVTALLAGGRSDASGGVGVAGSL